jgi:hypothetical protein
MAKQKKRVARIEPKALCNSMLVSRYKRQWYHGASPTKKNLFPNPYVVSEPRIGDIWECSCMNWTRNNPREDCKHILRVKLQYAVPTPVAPVGVGLQMTFTGRIFR